MKRPIFILVCLSILFRSGYAQRVATWKSYLSYTNTTLVTEGNNYVFAVADGALYSYNKNDKSISYYAKETDPALSDNKITSIGYNQDQNTLIIAYENGNIDLLSDNGLYNLPFLKENSSIQDKQINSIYNDGATAYLSANFGIVVLNLSKKEVKETSRLSKAVTSVAIKDNYIYATTSDGMLRGAVNSNLIDPNNWNTYTVSGLENSTISKVVVFQNTLCYMINKKAIYYQTNNGVQSLITGDFNGMKVENGKLLAFTYGTIYIYSSLTQFEKGDVVYGTRDITSTKDANTYWIAAETKGIIGIERTGANQYQTILSDINNNSPKRNYADFLMMHNDKLYVAGGGRWTEQKYRAGTVMIYDTNEKTWTNIADVSGFSDATSIAVDPNDETHFYVSSWGKGIYEYKDNTFVTRYGMNNSPLESSITNDTNESYVRVEGLCFDSDNNLWMTNSGSTTIIKILKADGTWASLRYADTEGASLVDKILFTNNGNKWVNLVRATNRGILVFNDNGTIDDSSDDEPYFTSALSNSSGSVGESEYLCITEDKNGKIWIGTNRGPVVVENPANILVNKGNTPFDWIVLTDDDGNSTSLLRDEQIKAIAVDGANRKWLGTGNTGLYLVSEDGKKTIEHFTAENSPLLSNVIESIAINNKTGEVFIGTDKGLVSYWGDATQGSESYSDVYAYPNPVRPNYNQNVIVTGLMENSNVKITDIKGNLIYQTKSVGGQISWDCKNRSGRYVAAGVYLVFAATPEGKESVVTKIAVVR